MGNVRLCIVDASQHHGTAAYEIVQFGDESIGRNVTDSFAM